MNEIKDGGPAFPSGETVTEVRTDGSTYTYSADPGMTLRDYFAIRAPEPTAERMTMERQCDRNRNPYNEVHKPPIRSDVEIRCDLAYEYANAMLRARGQA
jgi:hypothetical protein